MIADYLQSMDTVHWFGLGVAFAVLAGVLRRRWPLGPAVATLVAGILVLRQPGLFWYQQWAAFAGLSGLFVLLLRRRS